MDTQIWLPIATLVLGLVLGYVGDWLRDERVSRRDRETRRRDRQYDAIMEALDLIGERHLLSRQLVWDVERHFAETGRWSDDPDFRFDESRTLAYWSAGRRLLVLNTVIDDRELSTAIGEIVDSSGRMVPGGNREDVRKATKDMLTTVGRFRDRARLVLAELP